MIKYSMGHFYGTPLKTLFIFTDHLQGVCLAEQDRNVMPGVIECRRWQNIITNDKFMQPHKKHLSSGHVNH
jgi:hypothetical protein